MTIKAFSADAGTTGFDVGEPARAIERAALGAENTDGEIDIPLGRGLPDGAGVWTPTAVGGIFSQARAAGAATESLWIDVPIPNRTPADKGIKPTGLTVNYSVGTADATDVTCELWKVTQGADGAAPTAVCLFGDVDGDYDAAHDSQAKRGDDTAAPELHKATVVDAGTPAYVGVGETLLFRFRVVDPGTSVVTLTSAVMQYSATLVDLA